MVKISKKGTSIFGYAKLIIPSLFDIHFSLSTRESRDMLCKRVYLINVLAYPSTRIVENLTSSSVPVMTQPYWSQTETSRDELSFDNKFKLQSSDATYFCSTSSSDKPEHTLMTDEEENPNYDIIIMIIALLGLVLGIGTCLKKLCDVQRILKLKDAIFQHIRKRSSDDVQSLRMTSFSLPLQTLTPPNDVQSSGDMGNCLSKEQCHKDSPFLSRTVHDRHVHQKCKTQGNILDRWDTKFESPERFRALVELQPDEDWDSHPEYEGARGFSENIYCTLDDVEENDNQVADGMHPYDSRGQTYRLAYSQSVDELNRFHEADYRPGSPNALRSEGCKNLPSDFSEKSVLDCLYSKPHD